MVKQEVAGMCNGPGRAASVTEALAMLDHALDYLADTDAASLPGDIQAEALRALERAQSKHTVARARSWPPSPPRPPLKMTGISAAPVPG